MAKLVSLSAFQDFLDAEFAWRLKEISTLTSNLRSTSSLSKSTVARASLALLYAHWEGFIKAAATGYLEYVSRKGLRYSELIDCFVFMGLRKHLNELTETRKSSLGQSTLLFLREKLDAKSNLNFAGAIRTDGNLKSQAFDDIARSIGIDTSRYSLYYNLMDERLLAKRNRIAHGDYLEVDEADLKILSGEILDLMRWFKTDLENAASQEAFKRNVA